MREGEKSCLSRRSEGLNILRLTPEEDAKNMYVKIQFQEKSLFFFFAFPLVRALDKHAELRGDLSVSSETRGLQ